MTDLTPREIAEREVRDLDLDKMVRAASRGGRFDGTANYYREIRTETGSIEVYSTSGAGTNSASVRVARAVVYECGEHGRYLRSYRRGAWVETVRWHARVQLDLEAADRLLRDASAEQKENDAFTPLEG